MLGLFGRRGEKQLAEELAKASAVFIGLVKQLLDRNNLQDSLLPAPLFAFPVSMVEYMLDQAVEKRVIRSGSKNATVVAELEKLLAEQCTGRHGNDGRGGSEKPNQKFLAQFTHIRTRISAQILSNELEFERYKAKHSETENTLAVLSMMAVLMSFFLKSKPDEIKSDARVVFSMLNTQLSNTATKLITKHLS